MSRRKIVNIHFQQVHKQPITGISVSYNDPNLFLTISEDMTMRLFDIRANSSVKIFMIQGKGQTANCLLGNAVYAVHDSTITMFDLRQEMIIKEVKGFAQLTSDINQISMNHQQSLISAHCDSGESIIFDPELNQQSRLHNVHTSTCFTGDFIEDDEYGQLCITAGFDQQIVLWDIPQSQAIKITNLNKIHPQYSGISVTPPIIYSAVAKDQNVLIATETGQVYNFNVKQLKKKKNKQLPLPEYVIDGHLSKVMRAVFFNDNVCTVSTDKSFALWNRDKEVLRVQIPEKPNWIECVDNNILVSDITNKLYIYKV